SFHSVLLRKAKSMTFLDTLVGLLEAEGATLVDEEIAQLAKYLDAAEPKIIEAAATALENARLGGGIIGTLESGMFKQAVESIEPQLVAGASEVTHNFIGAAQSAIDAAAA